MWCSWCASAAADATTGPFSSPAHFRNCYLVPSALAPNRVLRDDEPRWRSRRHLGGGTALNSKRTKKLTARAVILLLSASLSAQMPTASPQKPASHSAAKTHKVSHHPSKKSRKPRG